MHKAIRSLQEDTEYIPLKTKKEIIERIDCLYNLREGIDKGKSRDMLDIEIGALTWVLGRSR